MVRFLILFVFFAERFIPEMKQTKTICTTDTTAFEKAVSGIRSQLLRTAIGYLHHAEEAEDAVQEVLMRCWIVRQRLDHLDDLPFFATRILKNLCTDLLRTKKFSVEYTCEDEEDAPPADARLIGNEQQAWMNECLKRLPAGARAVLQMKGVDDLTYPEMAAILGTTEATVRAKVAKARQQLWTIYSKRK